MPLIDTIMQPFKVLKQAIDKVPFVKYALGIAGIGAAIAIIKSFGIEGYNVPVISLLVFLGLMVLLFVFSSLTKSKDRLLKFAGYLLVYTVTVTTCVSAILLVTSIFFKYPDRFENIISPDKPDKIPELSIKDLSLEVSLLKSDSTTLTDLTPEQIAKYISIDPPVKKTGQKEKLKLKFNLPDEYKNLKNYIALRFNFSKEIYQNASGGDLLGSDVWKAPLLGSENRYFESETDFFPNKLIFETNYQTVNK